jgi:hypothetical protein
MTLKKERFIFSVPKQSWQQVCVVEQPLRGGQEAEQGQEGDTVSKDIPSVNGFLHPGSTSRLLPTPNKAFIRIHQGINSFIRSEP